MRVNEDNYIETIKSFSEIDWLPLLDLIPEIETTLTFGEMNYYSSHSKQ